MNKLVFAAALTALALPAAAQTFYVATDGDDKNDGSAERPVKSLQQAINLTRSLHRDEPGNEIIVRDGTYQVDRKIRLNKEDYDLTIRAEHPGKVTLTSLVKVTGWKQDETDKRMLVAPLPFNPTPDYAYIFLVDGKKCSISRYPKQGRLGYKGGGDQSMIGYTENTFPQDFDLKSLDKTSVWLEIPQEYSSTRSLIKDIDFDTRTIALQTPAAMSFFRFNQGFMVYNSRMGMLEPGTWMFENSKKQIIYYPREGETAETLQCQVTTVPTYFDVRQTRGLTLDGFAFDGTCESTDPKKNGGYSGDPLFAAIFLFYPQDCIVKNCEFRNCAKTGLYAMKPNGCKLINCWAHDVGETGLAFDGGAQHCDILNCKVENFGQNGEASTGIIFTGYDLRAIGNLVHHGPGNGFTMWAAHVLFASNDIHTVMLAKKDGGGLYGGLQHAILKDNYVHNIWWPGLYPDEGSRHVVFTGNVFEYIGWPIHAHCAQYVTVTNNVFKDTGRYRISFQGSGHCVFSDNKLYADSENAWDGYMGQPDKSENNEVFVKQEDGTYKSVGMKSAGRWKKNVGKFSPRHFVRTKKNCPFNPEGNPDYDAFGRMKAPGMVMLVGEDGYGNDGVPCGHFTAAYDDNYLYLGFTRSWNKLMGFVAWKNFSNHGWRHCDANRVDFEGGRHVIVYPDGTWDAKGFTLTKRDVKALGDGASLIRIPLAQFNFKDAKKLSARLVLDGEAADYSAADDDVDLLLADQGPKEMSEEEKNMPKALDVSNIEIKFNASIWIEDQRELKSAWPVGDNADDWATGTLVFEKSAAAKKKGVL